MHQNTIHRAVKGSFGTISTIYFVTKDTFVATIVNKKKQLEGLRNRNPVCFSVHDYPFGRHEPAAVS